MKEIETYIREGRLNEVVRALRTAGAKAVTSVMYGFCVILP